METFGVKIVETVTDANGNVLAEHTYSRMAVDGPFLRKVEELLIGALGQLLEHAHGKKKG